MRTLALASISFLREFAGSKSAGKKLVAVAILQVNPEIEYVDWLAGLIKTEKPFIGYQAAVALQNAVRKIGREHCSRIESALNQAITNLGEVNKGTDRGSLILDAISQLQNICKKSI